MSIPSDFQAVFKRYIFQEPEPGVGRQKASSFFLGDYKNAEDISSGYVAFFYFPERSPDNIAYAQQKITGVFPSIMIPLKTGDKVNTLYFLYSRIRLTAIRLGDIAEDIKEREKRPRLMPSGRAIKIPVHHLFFYTLPLLEHDSAPCKTETAANGKKTYYIYLYDWYGYLEYFTNIYSNEIMNENRFS